MKPADSIRFEDFHRPAMKDGLYKMQLNIASGNGSPALNYSSDSFYFSIRGERFLLGPNLIGSNFPPENGFGYFDQVLPFIELKRSTLPWERIAFDKDENVPWLALILIDEDEIKDASQFKFEQKSSAEIRTKLGLAQEPGEALDSTDKGGENFQVQVLWLDKDLAVSIFPYANELKNLTHIRIAYNRAGILQEHPSILCNRLPKPGKRSKMFLVSVEGRFGSDGKISNTMGLTGKMLPFVVLKQWEFTCLPTEISTHHGATFMETCNRLDAGQLRFPSELIKKDKINESSFNNLICGFTPIPHTYRGGAKTLSWYRGPLVPVHLDYSKTPEPASFPIMASDVLLKYDNSREMLDISLSAAWELGRLLMLSDSQMSSRLQRWKLANTLEYANAEDSLIHGHLPFNDRRFNNSDDGNLGTQLYEFFNNLQLLKGIPFHYLVPDIHFLPNESIRYFEVDTMWMKVLMDGAFSIGRTGNVLKRNEGKIPNPPHQLNYPQLSGVLIRSSLVTDYQSLQIDAFDIELNNQKSHNDKDLLNEFSEGINEMVDTLSKGEIPDSIILWIQAKFPNLSDNWELSSPCKNVWSLNNMGSLEYFLIQKEKTDTNIDCLRLYDEFKLPVLRFERLSPGVLIVLFLGRAKTIDVHLPAEALHYGFEPLNEEGKYMKELRNLDSGDIIYDSPDKAKKVEAKQRNSQRIVDIELLKSEIETSLGGTTLTSGKLAIELIQGTPRKRFLLNNY